MRNLVLLALAGVLALPTLAAADTVRVSVAGHYEYVGALPSPVADFTLSFLVDRSPTVCGGTTGGVLVCGLAAPAYDDGATHGGLGVADVVFYDAGAKGGFSLGQSDLALNRLGFRIGAAQLFSGSLAAPTLIDGVYPICPAHFGQVHAYAEGELCSYAGQGFASGDPIHNPFIDPVTLQSDDPILSGTLTIAPFSAAPEPSQWALLLAGLGLAGASMRRRRTGGATVAVGQP